MERQTEKETEREMELRGNTNGGLHGYRRVPQTSSYMTEPDISTVQPPNGTNHHNTTASNATTEDTECIVREQDHFMPIANVIRIMRKVLPRHAKISDDAKDTVQECVSEFIGFITGEANDRCQQEQRKTITAEDLLWAMNKLGFDDYIEPLMVYLNRYRELEGSERGSLRGEPLVKRAVDQGPVVFPGFPPSAFHPMAPHYGYFGVVPVNGFFEDPAAGSAGPSQPAVAYAEPFPPFKE